MQKRTIECINIRWEDDASGTPRPVEFMPINHVKPPLREGEEIVLRDMELRKASDYKSKLLDNRSEPKPETSPVKVTGRNETTGYFTCRLA